MAIRDQAPKPTDEGQIQGTVWERLASLRGTAGPAPKRPFLVESPGQNETSQLVANERRTIQYRGRGEILLFNIDLPAGVTLKMSLDGGVRRFSHGNEAGLLRWEPGSSPLRFDTLLEVLIVNTTAAGASYRVHVSGV